MFFDMYQLQMLNYSNLYSYMNTYLFIMYYDENTM